MAHDPIEDGQRSLILGLTAAEMADLFLTGTRREVEAHLASGHAVYGADEIGTVYGLRPDGREVPIASSRPNSSATPDARAS